MELDDKSQKKSLTIRRTFLKGIVESNGEEFIIPIRSINSVIRLRNKVTIAYGSVHLREMSFNDSDGAIQLFNELQCVFEKEEYKNGCF